MITQQETELSLWRIEGYLMATRTATEIQFYDARKELVSKLERDIECAKKITFKDFQSTYQRHLTKPTK